MKNMRAYWLHLLTVLIIASPCVIRGDEAADELQRAKDTRIVQVLLRLQNVDLSEKPEHKAAILRYLKTIQGTEKYFELIDRFGLKETRDELLAQAIDKSDTTAGVESARMLVKFNERELLSKTLADTDEAKTTKLLQALGLLVDPKINDLVLPLVIDEKHSRSVRTAATAAIGRNVPGQKALLAIVEGGRLPADLNFAAGNALFASADPAIRDAAAKHIKLPATANAEPIPPVAELVKRDGDAVKGQKIYATTGTCAKCHKVRGEGKEVGPDLSEIGSKLSKEAFFVSILDPSAGISHNFETYSVVTDDGNVVIGLLVSDTADAVTIKTAEAIVRTIPKSQIEDFKKQKVSLMPADLQKLMTVQDLIDVVAYLGTLKKM